MVVASVGNSSSSRGVTTRVGASPESSPPPLPSPMNVICKPAGFRPVKRAARDGVQRGEAAYPFEKRMPDDASRSRLGVLAPEPFDAGLRSSIWTEELVHPAPSPRTTIKFGAAADAAPTRPAV